MWRFSFKKGNCKNAAVGQKKLKGSRPKIPRMTGAVDCLQMLYWQSRNQWAHLRPGGQKGDGKAIAENLNELPASIAGAGGTDMCFTPVCQHHQKGQGLGGFQYAHTYREASECVLEAHTPRELPSTLGHAECAVKNKIPASMEKHGQQGKGKGKPSLTNLLEFGEGASEHMDALRHGGVQ